MKLSREVLKSLRNLFFGNRKDTSDTTDACERWSKMIVCFNCCDAINHLWADRSFRDAYYDAGQIEKIFYKYILVDDGSKYSDLDLYNIIEEVMNQVDYQNLTGWQKMLDAALIILPDTQFQKEYNLDREEFEQIVRDFKAIVAFTKSMSHMREIQDHLATELSEQKEIVSLP